jgi:uncharacterized protein DUF481
MKRLARHSIGRSGGRTSVSGNGLFRFDKTNLNVTSTVLPALSNPGRIHTNLDVAYYIKLWSKLNWNISFYGNWDNQPPPGFSSSDYGTSSGISYTFGNR